MILNNSAFTNMSCSRSNLNPSAPEFQHYNRLPSLFIPPPIQSSQASISNGPLSANIINIDRIMEQKQQQQQQLYINNTNVPIHPPPPSLPSQSVAPI
ncbi:unnamed protein product [Rotaria sordida]|uniref:Uncharacterized protein n=1 Tax=Rotaria sordida TaxID=392033 RepID=A0A815MIB7_9BILA|nr:unnamed protein product [Rotaria sordida]CAF1629842.1 unnamed protein product [Rotaria sordida]